MTETVKIAIVKGVEGIALYVNDYRIAGPKPWGGGRVVKQWTAHRKDFARALSEHIPSTEPSDE